MTRVFKKVLGVAVLVSVAFGGELDMYICAPYSFVYADGHFDKVGHKDPLGKKKDFAVPTHFIVAPGGNIGDKVLLVGKTSSMSHERPLGDSMAFHLDQNRSNGKEFVYTYGGHNSFAIPKSKHFVGNPAAQNAPTVMGVEGDFEWRADFSVPYGKEGIKSIFYTCAEAGKVFDGRFFDKYMEAVKAEAKKNEEKEGK